MHVTLAAEKDLPEIAALVNSAYRGESSRAGWTNEAHLLGGERISAEILMEEQKDPNRKILCYRSGEQEKLLGCVSLELNCGARKNYCYLGMLTVSPTEQNQSIGRKLMAEAEKFAKSAGAMQMILGVVHLRAELIGWYKRRGYELTGETKPFPSDAVRFPRLTDQPLHFVFLEKAL